MVRLAELDLLEITVVSRIRTASHKVRQSQYSIGADKPHQ
jgi:hypothetical protein